MATLVNGSFAFWLSHVWKKLGLEDAKNYIHQQCFLLLVAFLSFRGKVMMDAVAELATMIGVQYLRAYSLMDEGCRTTIDTLVGIVHDGAASPKARDVALAKIHSLTTMPWKDRDE